MPEFSSYHCLIKNYLIAKFNCGLHTTSNVVILMFCKVYCFNSIQDDKVTNRDDKVLSATVHEGMTSGTSGIKYIYLISF